LKTYEQKVREGPGSFRYVAIAALMGSGGLVAALTGMPKSFSLLVVGIIFLAANIFIWLRQNPTLKQIEKRRQNQAAAGAADEDAT
jgi:hypothetical protein